MGQTTNEVKQTKGVRVKKSGGSALLIALGLTAVIMAGAYSALCAWAGSRTVFYPNETISGVAVGGLSMEQAAQVLSSTLPGQTVTVTTEQEAEKEGWPEEAEPASITLEELARHLHYTVPYCSRYVKKLFGCTFSQLLNQIRFQKAHLFLKNSSLTVNQISKMLGYENPENFMRAFKKIHKMTPSQYRALYHGKAGGDRPS